MSVRIEAITKIQERVAKNGSIVLPEGGGKKARKKLIATESAYNNARRKVIEHEYATGYRLWVGGGSRYDVMSPESDFTRKLTQAIVKELGIDVITGAGPGIMGAASQGLIDAKQQAKGNDKEITARSLGIGLKVPWEEDRTTFDYYRDHPELLTRVQELIDLSHAAYVGPGAIGTNFELWALIQLKQMGHIEPEYALVVHPSWKQSIEDFRKQWFEERKKRGERPTMNEEDLNITFSDNIPEITAIITESWRAWNESVGQHIRRRSRIFPWQKKKINQ